jgi:hypothetical protein
MRTLLLAAPSAAALAVGGAVQAAQDFPGHFGFQGRYLAVLSDADMVATAYVHGQLGPRGAGMRDTLSLIPLGAGAAGLRPVEVPVSNAVTAWPSNLAITPDSRFAFVTEVDEPPPAGATRRAELSPGRRVSIVDLRDAAAPRVIQTVELQGRTHAATLTPDERTLAVNVAENPQRPTAQTTLDFFRLVEGPRPMLVQMDVRVPVMSGAHVVKLVR